MCIILLACRAHADYPLIVAANRDEYYARPTARAAFWEDAPELLAGRDLEHKGTWLGVTRGGRFAAVTNFRDPVAVKKGAPSRGHLVSDFLRSWETSAAYLNRIVPRAQEYNGFNLFAGWGAEVYYYSNRDGAPALLAPGIHGLSNHLLNTSWPKVEQGKRALAALLRRDAPFTTEDFFRILADRAQAEDSALPHTGVGLELERMLSSVFIKTPVYGTRSSTLLMIDRAGRLTFTERTYAPGSEEGSDACFQFEIENARRNFPPQ